MPDAATAHAASVLVQSALKLRAGERVVLVEDAGCVSIADAISSAVDAGGGWVKRCRLDKMTTGGSSARPHKVIPELLLLALHDADASVFVASAPPAELSMRQALLHVVRQRRLRHAHMPGITEATFSHGMRLEYTQVQRLGARVLGRMAGARVLVSESAAGTSLMMALGPETKWLAQLGALQPGEWGNFPAGALYTSPADVSGVFVADASLGEFFGAREGLLRPNPVRFLVDGGRVVDVQARSPQLRKDIEAMLGVSPNSDRVGLVAIGVNAGIDAPIGDVLLDQNVPGLHIGIGDPAARATGAGWSAPTCFAACQAVSRVCVDGDLIVESGRVVLASRRSMPAHRIHTPVPT